MAKNLAENLVNLSGRTLGPDRTAKLGLNHREGSLDIRPLVIVGKKRISIEVVEMPHALPEFTVWLMPLTPLE